MLTFIVVLKMFAKSGYSFRGNRICQSRSIEHWMYHWVYLLHSPEYVQVSCIGKCSHSAPPAPCTAAAHTPRPVEGRRERRKEEGVTQYTQTGNILNNFVKIYSHIQLFFLFFTSLKFDTDILRGLNLSKTSH